jgi:glycosyltransferase involved in cell wall biosynthesis
MIAKRFLAIYMDVIHPTSKLIAREFGIESFFCYRRSKLLHPYSTTLRAPFLAKNVEGYDIYLLEGLTPAPLLPFIKNQKNQVVVIGNSHELFFIERNWMRRVFFTGLVNLNKYVDHMIAVSKMIKEDFEKYFKFDIKVAELFMHRDYRKLSKLPVNLERRNFIFIGVNPFLKGVDIMVDAFLRLKKKGIIKADTKFYLIGGHENYLERKGYKKEILQRYKIVTLPATPNLEEYLKDSLFQFHLARYEPNAVAIMEGMASGHIPIVSYKTGNKDFIAQINSDLVIDSFDMEEIEKHVKKIVGLSEEELRNLSLRFRRMSAFYSTEVGLKRWKKTWHEIVKE